MEIALELKNYCIETAVKKTYEKLLVKYFNESDSVQDLSGIEAQIEGLKYVLERIDFRNLRGSYPALNGRKQIQVKIKIPENMDNVIIICEEEAIHPVSKIPGNASKKG